MSRLRVLFLVRASIVTLLSGQRRDVPNSKGEIGRTPQCTGQIARPLVRRRSTGRVVSPGFLAGGRPRSLREVFKQIIDQGYDDHRAYDRKRDYKQSH